MASRISVLAELERLKWTFKPLSDSEVKLQCPDPGHDDKDPSATMNVESGLWNCKVCPAKGDFVQFYSLATGKNRSTVFKFLSTMYDLEEVKTVDVSVVETAFQMLPSQPHLLKALRDRGITDEDLRKYRIGYQDGRVTIPVKNAHGLFVNIRKYLPGAPGPEKMRNLSGRGQTRLYPIEQMEYETIVLCAGEMKAILAARLLNSHGIGAVCATAGEGNWEPELTMEFKGKKVYVMMDVDDAGVKAAEAHLMRLRLVASWLGWVQLPLDRDKHPKGDVNDFVAAESGDLVALVLGTPQWLPDAVPDHQVNGEESVLSCRLHETVRATNVGRRMRFSGVVSASVVGHYVVPRRVKVKCGKMQNCCPLCAVYASDATEFDVSPESPSILQMVHAASQHLDGAMRDAIRVPRACKDAQLDVTGHFDVEDVQIAPSLEISNQDVDKSARRGLCVSCTGELNASYEFTGRMFPHPQNQQATLVLSEAEAAHDALSTYVPTDLEKLRVFRPDEWSREGIETKLHHLYSDLERNVTRIFMRHDVHLFVDLAYHSPLLLDLDGKEVKGWVETLIVGDSAQGKSYVFDNLLRHYRVGEKLVCKGATPAGLLGGVKKVGEQWIISWGVIPTHDRRLVGLEEMKGMSTEAFSKCTDMRSSGVAEITKIEKKRTLARTRLVGLSNCRHDRTVSSYAFGVEAVRDLIGAPEDIRRFDAALIVSKEEVDPGVLDELRRNPPDVPHVYTSELCHSLILWAWTRKRGDVLFDEDASEHAHEEAVSLSKKYSAQIPLVDAGSMPEKLSRLAASVACRTFSTQDEDETKVRVRRCHVKFVVALLDRVYSSKIFGYEYYSRALQQTHVLRDPAEIKSAIESTINPKDLHQHLLFSDYVDQHDLRDWVGGDYGIAGNLLSVLVRKQALKKIGRTYVKTPEFIEWLNRTTIVDRPDHLKKETDKDGKEKKF